MNIKNIIDNWKEKRAEKKAKKARYFLNIYFGVPGSGKSTLSAWIAKQCHKKNRDVYSNFPIAGCYELNCRADLGVKHIEESDIIIDEVGLEYSNRDFKDFPKTSRYFFKFHRHYKDNVHIFSQDYEDMDKTLRKLAQRYYLMKKSIIPGFVVRREIGKRIGINDMTKEICEEYFFVGLLAGGIKWIWCPPLWKMFDSYSYKQLEQYEFRKWDDMSEGEKLAKA